MKRLLVITYYWPPSAGSGVQRWLKFSKFLPSLGWQPVIYTPENPDFAIQDPSLLKNIPDACEVIKQPIWEPYKLYRTLTGRPSGTENQGATGDRAEGLMGRLSRWIRGTFFLPDPRRTWVRPSIRYLDRYLAEHPVDAMVSTGPPHSMHLIALGLKQRFPALPWLADMRDPWATFDIHASFMNASARARNQELQRKVVTAADRVVLTSPGAAQEFSDAPPDKLVVLNNGFDPDDFPASPATRSEDGFRLIHSGLLNSIRDVPVFWQTLDRCLAELPEVDGHFRLELLGTVDPEVTARIRELPHLGKRLAVHGWVPHETLLKQNQQASAFLVIVNQSANAASQLPGKIYEYFALGQPVLALCPHDSALADIVRATGTGFVLDPEDPAGLRDQLAGILTRSHVPTPKPEVISRYSRKALTQTLVEVLETLLP